MDEFEFEVGATDTGQQRSVRGLRVRRPPRGVTVGLIAACVVAVTTGLALASVPNLSGRVNVLLHGTPLPPTATPRILPGGDLLYVVNAVSWGTLTIDGKTAALNENNSTSLPAANFLERGVHAVAYRADPFPVLRCKLSVPASKTDTCPLDSSYTFPTLPAGIQNYAARAMDLTPTLDKLPAAARTSLLQTISTYVTVRSPATTVRPGERYVNAGHQIVYADQQLTATFTQTLATSASPTSNGCAVLCMPAPVSGAYPAPGPVADFVVDAHLTQGFTYVTASGQPVVTGAPISANSAVSGDGVEALTVMWNGAWQVALVGVPQSSSAACVAGAQALQPYLVDPRDGGQQFLYVDAAIPAANPADGCVYRVNYGGAYGGQPTASEFIHLLYRFGVVLAVNDASDAEYVNGNYLLRGLPFTDDAETALALQIDATQPYN